MDEGTLTILLTTLATIVAAVGGLLVVKINALATETKERAHNEKVNRYIDIADDAVCTAVGAVSQIMVDALKAAAIDGALSDSDARAAYLEAKNRALAIMGVAGKAAVKELYGDFDQWLTNKIEYYVGALK